GSSRDHRSILRAASAAAAASEVAASIPSARSTATMVAAGWGTYFPRQSQYSVATPHSAARSRNSGLRSVILPSLHLDCTAPPSPPPAAPPRRRPPAAPPPCRTARLHARSAPRSSLAATLTRCRPAVLGPRAAW